MAMFLCALFAVACASASVRAEDTVADSLRPDTSGIESVIDTPRRLALSIERVTSHTMAIYDTLDVSLKGQGISVAGFDIKIAVDNPLIDILEIFPGEIYDSCAWDFFSARRMQPGNREGVPRVMWQAVALADGVPDTTRPVCFGFEREASLLRMVVSSEHAGPIEDTAVAIFFYWEDCTDNTLSNLTGDTLRLTDRVYDYFPTGDFEGDDLFPTRLGAPQQCINPKSLNRPLRQIECHNGGVEFRMDMGGGMPEGDSLKAPVTPESQRQNP